MMQASMNGGVVLPPGDVGALGTRRVVPDKRKVRWRSAFRRPQCHHGLDGGAFGGRRRPSCRRRRSSGESTAGGGIGGGASGGG